MINDEARHAIDVLVRSGFYEPDEIVEIVCEQVYEPDEADEEEVTVAVDEAVAKWRSEQDSWPEVTDCDRLDQVFDALNERGIIALQNAGYTQSDGLDDVSEIYANHDDRDSVIGYCFYHGQDLERAVNDDGLLLSFGPSDPKEEETKGPLVGNIIREELERAGFAVVWDGTFKKRIEIPKLLWQRRA